MNSRVIRTLTRQGLLLQQDKKLPSVVGLIAGEALSSSWWSHARAQEIFECLALLGERDDVLITRLVARKVTFVHQRLWPALFTVATSGEEWQTRGLSRPARTLLRRIETSGTVEATGAAVRESQERLLASAVEIHTGTGRHAMALQSWRTAMPGMQAMDLDLAKRQLEESTVAIGGTVTMLPWRRR